jgi:hypothetical protein
MINPIIFTLNIIFMCAMMTFLPSIAFALANSTVGGKIGFPVFSNT